MATTQKKTKTKKSEPVLKKEKPLKFTITKTIDGSDATMEEFERCLESRAYFAATAKNPEPRPMPRTLFCFIQNKTTGEWDSIPEEYLTRTPIDGYRTFSFLGYGPISGIDWSYDVTNHPWLGNNVHRFIPHEQLNNYFV